MAAVFYGEGISIAFMRWEIIESIEVYTIYFTSLSVEIVELCLNVQKLKKPRK